jgi:ADP-ribose pyrophosphatase YjhB (NUDIX family)
MRTKLSSCLDLCPHCRRLCPDTRTSQPADAVLREVEEETGIIAEVQSLAGVSKQPVKHSNGDRVDYPVALQQRRPEQRRDRREERQPRQPPRSPTTATICPRRSRCTQPAVRSAVALTQGCAADQALAAGWRRSRSIQASRPGRRGARAGAP